MRKRVIGLREFTQVSPFHRFSHRRVRRNEPPCVACGPLHGRKPRMPRLAARQSADFSWTSSDRPHSYASRKEPPGANHSLYNLPNPLNSYIGRAQELQLARKVSALGRRWRNSAPPSSTACFTWMAVGRRSWMVWLAGRARSASRFVAGFRWRLSTW
jgi:hypothetical protein